MVANPAKSRRASINEADGATRLFVVWTLLVVFCQCAGWGLSAIHQLNALGYAITFLVFFAIIGFWWRKNANTRSPFNFTKLKHRFTKPFPLGFLILGTLGVLGGILYAPNNFDGLAYRTPRVLNWLAEGRWYWIHSHFGNLNTRGAGFEWITAPLFVLTKSDRLEFLINTICFLFLPGRVFAVLIRLRICPRVAYYWMWIYPTGYGFLLQTGSIANDMFSAVWPIAAFEFALRARDAKRVEWAWLSMFAAALMTASKAFNLLLLPACGLALLPTIPLLLRRRAASLAIVLISAVASMIPTAILNAHYCGDWTGLVAEPIHLNTGRPLLRLSVNAVLILLQNLAPPIFPFSGAWDHFVNASLPTSVATRLNQFFEGDAAHFRIPELQAEESAGLGFGVSILLLTIVLRQLRLGGRPALTTLLSFRSFIAAVALGGAAIFMVQSGLYAPARYLLPLCFPIILPILALPAAAILVEQKWWQRFALALFGLAALLLILSPARPLWPALTTLRNVDENSKPILQRAARVYSIYRQRHDVLRPIREKIPPNTKTIGLIAFNEPETSLWLPYGSRRVLHMRREDSPQFTRERGIQYVVMSPAIAEVFKTTPEEWAQRNNGEIIGRFHLEILARGSIDDWVLVRLNP